MCFSNVKTPDYTPPPQPAPSPSPVATRVDAANDASNRAKLLAQFKYGMASTIKTSPRGITGSGPNLQAPTLIGEKRLGA